MVLTVCVVLRQTWGATAVATLCAQLEELGIEGHLDGAPELLDGLAVELERATSALRAAVAPGSA